MFARCRQLNHSRQWPFSGGLSKAYAMAVPPDQSQLRKICESLRYTGEETLHIRVLGTATLRLAGR